MAATLFGSPASASEVSPIFGGTGHGSTVQRGIKRAMDDVEVSARGEGWLGECTILAVTLIEDISGPTYTSFRVSVDATCADHGNDVQTAGEGPLGVIEQLGTGLPGESLGRLDGG